MKKLSLGLLFFIPMLLVGQETVIDFRVIDGAGKTVRVTKPVGGACFWASQSVDTLDADGALQVQGTDDVPGIYLFSFGQKDYRIYARPGEHFGITIDTDSAAQPLQIIGSQSEGQVAFNGHTRPFYQDAGIAHKKEYPVFAEARQKILEQINEELEPFERLLAVSKIDEGFFSAAEATIRSYYASVLIVSLFDEYQQLVVHPDSAGYDESAIADYLAKWDEVSEIQDVFDETAIISDSYDNLNNLYTEWYFSLFDPETRQPILEKPETPDGYWERPYWAIKRTFEGKLQEYLLASRIYFINVQNRFQSFQLDIFVDFTDTYPNTIPTRWNRQREGLFGENKS